MNFWGYFIFAAAAVLFFLTQQSNGLELALCLEGAIESGCQYSQNSVDNSNNLSQRDTISKNKDSNNAKIVLSNGFNNFNITLESAEKRANDGFSRGEKRASNPEAAAREVQDGIKDVRALLSEAFALAYQALGEASSFCNETSRQELAGANLKLQLVGLELYDQMRTVITSVNEGVIDEPDTLMQDRIETCRQSIQSAFDALYYVANISYQKSFEAVSDAQCQRPAQGQVKNQNAEDSDAEDAIAEINKASDDAIKKGADPSKVNALRKSMIQSLRELGQVAAYVRDYFVDTVKLAETDASSAKDIYLAKAKGVCKRVQEIFADSFLNLGAAAVNSDNSFKKQIREAFKALAQGNVELTDGDKIAKHAVLYGLLFKGDVRKSILNSAVKSGRHGKISACRRLVEAAKIVLSALIKN